MTCNIIAYYFFPEPPFYASFYHFSHMTSDLYKHYMTWLLSYQHSSTSSKLKVEKRFRDDLKHFASLIYSGANPERLAETLKGRLEWPKTFTCGTGEWSLLGIIFLLTATMASRVAHICHIGLIRKHAHFVPVSVALKLIYPCVLFYVPYKTWLLYTYSKY